MPVFSILNGQDPGPPVRLLYYVPIWGRQQLTYLHMEWVKRLMNYKPSRVQVFPHFVVSEQWAVDLCRHMGFSFQWADNRPVGTKLNVGLKAVINGEFDYMMTMGSDDFIEPSFLDAYYYKCFGKLDAFGLNVLHVLDAATGQQKRVMIGYAYGALRCIRWGIVRKSAIYQGAYRGFWTPISQGLDYYSMEALKERTGTVVKVVSINEKLWDVKDGNNINSFRKVGGDPVTVNPQKDMPKEVRKLYHMAVGMDKL